MNKAARIYVGVVIAAGAAMLGGAVAGVAPGDALLVGTLVLAAAAVQAWRISLYGESSVSLSVAIVAAAAFLTGVPGAALAGAGEGIGTVSSTRRPYKLAFNISALALAGGAAGLVVVALRPYFSEQAHAAITGEAVAAAAVNFAINSALVAVVVGLSSRRSPWSVWCEKHRWLIVHYAALGIFGAALAEGYRLAGPFGLLVFALPFAMQRISLSQYVRRTEDSVRELQEKNTALTVAHADLTRAHREVSALAESLKDTYDGTLLALVEALDARDTDTKGHSERVGLHTAQLAEVVGITKGSEEWETIYRGALLHDVGKIGVPDGILLKPGKLTPEEWHTMRKHPEIGHQMIRDIPFLAGAADIVLAHHERWDGDGYPKGLAGTEVPLGARLFSVADAFDAMLSDRPYRQALSVQQALDELLKHKGTQWDPQAVEALMLLYEEWLRSSYPGHPEAQRYILKDAA